MLVNVPEKVLNANMNKYKDFMVFIDTSKKLIRVQSD
jgi:hypothetical protein